MQEILINSKVKMNTNKAGKFKTKYGYFTNDGSEFVVTNPLTPRPWINVISNSIYNIIVSQTGSGYSWIENSNLSRVTTWIQDLVRDNYGKYVYIRDNTDDSFWSLGYKPVCVPYSFYEVRHGIGYSTITNVTNEIKAQIKLFVPKDEPLELWHVTLKNESDMPRNLSLFTYFEWCLGGGIDTHREFQKTFISTDYNQNLGYIHAKKKKQLVPKFISTGVADIPCEGFHSSSIAPSAFEADKEAFLGNLRDLNCPRAVEEGSLRNICGEWNDSIGSLKVDIELAPGEEKDMIFTLGISKDKKEIETLIRKYKDPINAQTELEKVEEFWSDMFLGLEVETPDEHMNFSVNSWFKYQAISCRIWARAAYFQQSGAYGFRDQLQDSNVFLPLKSELTKKQIILHAEHQFKDGAVFHWWHPTLDIGPKTNMTDDLLWLVFLTLNYIRETADYSILDEKVKFVDGQAKSLYIHCIKAIDKVLSRFSKRGLPLIGEGDWNDGLSNVGHAWRGESIWLGHYLYGILLEFSSISKRRKDKTRANRYLQKAKTLKTAINKHGWDGTYFMRATKDDGSPLGSKKCKEGKIFLNAQTWSIISGSATGEHAKKAMDSVRKHLYREYGPLLFNPAYTTPDASIGYVTRYAPGVRENGGVYTHAACWAIMAECILKKADNAYELYTKLSPILRSHNNPDLYKSEPYVLPGNTDGPESPYFGRGGWSWYTGSSAWLFKVLTEYMLGIRPTYEGLLIDPCIPRTWSHYKVRRLFRNAVYLIDIENPKHVSHGVRSITINSKYQRSNLITPQEENKVHRVKVVMG